MGDGMSDSDGRREAHAEERRKEKSRAETAKRLAGVILALDLEISKHDAAIRGKKAERHKAQRELEKLVGPR